MLTLLGFCEGSIGLPLLLSNLVKRQSGTVSVTSSNFCVKKASITWGTTPCYSRRSVYRTTWMESTPTKRETTAAKLVPWMPTTLLWKEALPTAIHSGFMRLRYHSFPALVIKVNFFRTLIDGVTTGMGRTYQSSLATTLSFPLALLSHLIIPILRLTLKAMEV